jgi:beta-lactamase class C
MAGIIPGITPILLLLFASLQACSEQQSNHIPLHTPAFEPLPLDSQLQAFLDDFDGYFRDSMILTMTPGAAVVVVKDGRIVFLKCYGVAAEGSTQKVDAHTVFRVGSLSKGFASVLTGILVDKGYLTWDTKIQRYLPEFKLRDKEQARRVEIRHLLSHTTGLPYHTFTNLIEEGLDLKTILGYLPYVKLSGREGEVYSYQNVAFSLIQPIMHTLTEKTFQQLLQENIFELAGMTDASCDFSTMQVCSNKALPHRLTEAAWVADTISPLYYDDFVAAGGVNASINDMGEWLKLLLGHKPDIISTTTLDEVFKPVIGTGLERAVLSGFIHRDSASYALGWRILHHEDNLLVYHAGMVNNFLAEIAFSRQDDIGLCVLFNAPTPMAGQCIQAFFQRWNKSQKTPIF